MRSLTPWRREGDYPSGLARFRSDMERMFDRFFEPWNGGEFETWAPPVDVKDSHKEITVCAELPGIKPEDIEVSISGDTLTLRGERREESEDRREGYYTRERRSGSFFRSIGLPPGADAARITAEFRNGELLVHIPKSETTQPRRIAVRSPAAQGTPEASPGRATGIRSELGDVEDTGPDEETKTRS